MAATTIVELRDILVTVIVTLIASSGFWGFILKRFEKTACRDKLLLGLAHAQIMTLAIPYIERGFITQDEYENLVKYLYKPYLEMGGNGSAMKIMSEVEQLPTRVATIKVKTGELKNETAK